MKILNELNKDENSFLENSQLFLPFLKKGKGRKRIFRRVRLVFFFRMREKENGIRRK